jgi:hypothetical protein
MTIALTIEVMNRLSPNGDSKIPGLRQAIIDHAPAVFAKWASAYTHCHRTLTRLTERIDTTARRWDGMGWDRKGFVGRSKASSMENFITNG